MARIQNRHVVLLGKRVDGGEERLEVLLRVNVLLPVRAQKNVPVRLKPQPLKHIARLDLVKIHPKNLRHR